MSVLDRFEKSVEGAVNGVFAKFGSKDLQPVDLSSALEREIDAEAMPVGRDRTVAPNEYRFKLSTPDFDRIEAWGSETLANELADNLTEYAKSQHYAFVGPVIVIFEEDLDLSKGNFNLTSESVQGNAVPVTTDAQTEDSPVLEVNGNQYLLTKDKTVIGRGSGCDIVIDDPGISRKHLEIDITDNGVIARDLGSTNGTYVEGHQVPAARMRVRQHHHHRPYPHPVLGLRPSPGVVEHTPESRPLMTELTFALLKYGFLILLWIFIWLAVRSLRKDIETFSPRPSRARRRREREVHKAKAETPQAAAPRPHRQPSASASSAASAQPTLLVIIDGPLAGSSVPLAEADITLGRAASNTVVLDDEFVSSHHARVYRDTRSGQWAIEDLNSTNGTVVNQQRINRPTILPARIPVRIGATTFELR